MSEIVYGRIRDLGGLPELLRSKAGCEGVADAFKGQELPLTLLDIPDAPVPMRDLIGLYHRAATITGIRSFGLEASHNSAIADRGLFGAYISQAPTLLGAFVRAQKVSPYFESGSKVDVEFAGDKLVLGHRHCLQEMNGWRHLSAFKLSLGIRLIRHYLGEDWHPELVQTCIPKGPWEQDYEDFFNAPTLFEEGRSALVLPRDLANTPRPTYFSPGPTATFAQIVRMGKAIPKTFVETVANTIEQQLLEGYMSIEVTASALGLGPRTIQRRLSEDGLTYRQLLTEVRMGRARDLLAEHEVTVKRIGRELGYSSPQQFTRAFKKRFEITPQEYRQFRD